MMMISFLYMLCYLYYLLYNNVLLMQYAHLRGVFDNNVEWYVYIILLCEVIIVFDRVAARLHFNTLQQPQHYTYNTTNS